MTEGTHRKDERHSGPGGDGDRGRAAAALACPAPAAGHDRRAGRWPRRLSGGWAVLAGALAALGAMLVIIAVLAQESPPAPPRDLGTIPAPGPVTPARTAPRPPGPGPAGEAAARASAARASAAREHPGLPPVPPAADPGPSPLALPWSPPASLAIPAIGVHTTMVDLGLDRGHTLQVPPLTPAGVREAGWYDLGPAPGQLGPAVIAGHVDSYQGPGVFYRLGALRPGDQIQITRADSTIATFRVDAVDEYAKDNFPARQVYGPIGYAGLRLITCGGRFDYQTRHYLSNIVIYATLTSSRPTQARHPR